MKFKSRIFMSISFTLTLIAVGIASLYVPSLESESRDYFDKISQLQNSYFMETQRYGQNSLNFSSAAQIIASERILYKSGKDKNHITRKVILQQGRNALINGLNERKKAVDNVVKAFDNILDPFSVTLSAIPEREVDAIFILSEDTDEGSIKKLQKYVQKIDTISKEYDKAWEAITKTLIATLNNLKKANSIIDVKISFWMKIALMLQIFAMVFVFIKERLSD